MLKVLCEVYICLVSVQYWGFERFESLRALELVGYAWMFSSFLERSDHCVLLSRLEIM